MNKYEYTPFQMETISVPSANSVATLSSKYFNPAGALPTRYVRVTVDPGPVIVYTIDGTTVSSATGHKLTSYGVIDLYGQSAIRNFKTTSNSSGTAGSITVTYFR